MMAHSIKDLKEQTDDEIIKRHDNAAQNTAVGVSYYLEELRARKMESYAQKMDRLTAGIFWMTLVVTIATCINVAIFVWEKVG